MNFYQLCDKTLSDLADKIEKLDIDSNLDIEYSDGVLNIVLLGDEINIKNNILNKNNQTFVINRNSSNQKIWYSSPFSGADYFAFDEEKKQWLSKNKQELTLKLIDELTPFLKQTTK